MSTHDGGRIALLWFDHIISFNEEVQRIWQRKFTGATLLFLITRYSATLERITLVVSLFLVTNENKVRFAALCWRKLTALSPAVRITKLHI